MFTIIYLAGIASGNEWCLVGKGFTMAQARADYQQAVKKLGFIPFGNYIETSYEQK
jgi:hypothetical protein